MFRENPTLRQAMTSQAALSIADSRREMPEKPVFMHLLLLKR